MRQLEELCAAGSCVREADRRVLRKELEAERKKLGNISVEGSGDPRTAMERNLPPRRAARIPFEPSPPEDYGWRPSVPSQEWLEDERERKREYLKSLVAVVTEG